MLSFKFATSKDVDLLYHWANDDDARRNSYNPDPIDYETHCEWFASRVESREHLFYIFFDAENSPIGQVRIDVVDIERSAVISISVDKHYRKRGYGTVMLELSTEHFLSENRKVEILAYIFKENKASYKSFLKAGFEEQKEKLIENIPSFVLRKKWIGF